VLKNVFGTVITQIHRDSQNDFVQKGTRIRDMLSLTSSNRGSKNEGKFVQRVTKVFYLDISANSGGKCARGAASVEARVWIYHMWKMSDDEYSYSYMRSIFIFHIHLSRVPIP